MSYNDGAGAEIEVHKQTGVHVQNQPFIVHGASKHDTTVMTVNGGSYTGNGATNRAIPHGLGYIPHEVFFFAASMIGYVTPDGTNWCYTASWGSDSHTAMDATNFYVGKGGADIRDLNQNTVAYRWVAL
jgi:hypothetical protein